MSLLCEGIHMTCASSCLLPLMCCLQCLLYAISGVLSLACCLLSVVSCVLSLVCCLLWIALSFVCCLLLSPMCCLLCAVSCLLSLVWCLLSCLLCVVFHGLSPVSCLLCVVFSVLSPVCYLLCAVSCMLSPVCYIYLLCVVSCGQGRTRVIDTSELKVWRKRVRPISKQGEFESRRLWEHVTNALNIGDVNTATEHKRFVSVWKGWKRKVLLVLVLSLN